MSFYTAGSTTGSVTGNRSYAGFGFQPSYVRFTVSQKNGTTESFVHFSEGFTDGTNQSCHSLFYDGGSPAGSTQQYTDRLIDLKARVSGTLTDILVANFVSFDVDGVTVNFTAIASGYRVYVEAFA